ncbi:hypothetical protein HDC30_002431 [Pseudomonas sp. JAI115]|uniref:hypothetical protein n=1 Tax=Pseudomonas sp. JAI115 TaxID=2723061 RepID=UPI001609F15F|nr:hypothetical protein [Pseudomonas sp. JAI115]MBB6155208.1 hypothetical protein [Pseudomonas sp. JAI115]
MYSTQSVTLEKLLGLKRRREQSQRAALAILAQQESELQASTSRLLDQRRLLWSQWRERSSVSEVLDPGTLRELKIDLADYNQHDHVLAERIDQLQSECSRVRLEQAEHQALLHKLLLEQEKLNLLLE